MYLNIRDYIGVLERRKHSAGEGEKRNVGRSIHREEKGRGLL